MKRLKYGIVFFSLFTFLFVVSLETAFAQQMSTFEGSVAAITTKFKKGIISVKGNKGEIVNFAVGRDGLCSFALSRCR